MNAGLSASPEPYRVMMFGWPWTRSSSSFSIWKRSASSSLTPFWSSLIATCLEKAVLDSTHFSSPRYALANRPDPSSTGWPCSSSANEYARDRVTWVSNEGTLNETWVLSSFSGRDGAATPGPVGAGVGTGGAAVPAGTGGADGVGRAARSPDDPWGACCRWEVGVR